MDDKAFWTQVRRGLMLVVTAIEYRYGFTRSSGFPIGQAAPPQEAPPKSEPPPSQAPASSHQEGVRADGVQ